MCKPSPDYLTIFCLPKYDNLAKAGIILYLLGIACTFFYFNQFNILSVDYLKPNAIILGIYQWVYFIAMPRVALLFVNYMVRNSRHALAGFVLFALLQIAANLMLFFMLGSFNTGSCLLVIFLTALLIIFHTNFSAGRLTITPPVARTYLFGIVFCFSFSYFIFPKIPYELGGAMPVKVNAVLSDSTLLQSRFSKSLYLLYATGDDYYFIEKKQDANTQLVFEYIIKKVSKSAIKKIEFTKSIWQPF
jgi:hypothetical protein